MMDKFEIAKNLMACFPNSFVNGSGEFVAHREANEYFILDNCETEEDVKCKILAWFSRGAYKSEPYATKRANEKFHNFMLRGINKYLRTNFTDEDMELIYTYFGNGCHADVCMEFVSRGFDMDVLRKLEAEAALKKMEGET